MVQKVESIKVVNYNKNQFEVMQNFLKLQKEFTDKKDEFENCKIECRQILNSYMNNQNHVMIKNDKEKIQFNLIESKNSPTLNKKALESFLNKYGKSLSDKEFLIPPKSEYKEAKVEIKKV